ncbi:hypothetical protein ACFL2V_19355 [Pseudomonadota bacterium]
MKKTALELLFYPSCKTGIKLDTASSASASSFSDTGDKNIPGFFYKKRLIFAKSTWPLGLQGYSQKLWITLWMKGGECSQLPVLITNLLNWRRIARFANSFKINKLQANASTMFFLGQYTVMT